MEGETPWARDAMSQDSTNADDVRAALKAARIVRGQRARSAPLTRSNTRSGGGSPLAAASAAAFS